MTAYASTVIDASADEVWNYLREFGNLAEWLPGITSCEIEEGTPSEPGAVRRVEGAGGLFRERLLTLDDASRSATYEILECPLPVRNYRGVYRVAPVTDSGRAFVEWSAVFDSDDEPKMTKILTRGVFEPGLASLHKRF
ncbi:SRPBCC family protein [Planomonospora sp. ID67723]|uniref:SRPBCC family protein n=1 Tax=Planomonospora sp. ID67723 TaxID=2738134 RepID=UPI0018C3E98F|nr:SRPBCC family protein [Planomonospora sp. ID67723]MBG0832082.1 SRPBCC family protein [Planomonospora sp. ID67723]